MRMKRLPLLFYVFAAIVTIGLGLGIRRWSVMFPEFVARFAPDALWASLIYWLMSITWRRGTPLRTAGAALLFSFAVEAYQLFHAPRIRGIRANRLAALVLGSGFLWSDPACYTAGVVAALAIDLCFRRITNPARATPANASAAGSGTVPATLAPSNGTSPPGNSGSPGAS